MTRSISILLEVGSSTRMLSGRLLCYLQSGFPLRLQSIGGLPLLGFEANRDRGLDLLFAVVVGQSR